ncbi:MAG: M55 family metallopeptidase [Victivallaceae bacterium]
MNIYIFVDMEGISGISGSDFVMPGNRFYSLGCQYYTMEVNSCINACFKANAKNVIVRDGHSSGNHIIWKEFDKRAELIQGSTGNKRFPGIEECSALILLGYHAMAGTQGALLEHTYSSTTIQNMWLNNIKAGEFAIDSAIAAEYNVPTIMVSGDDKICAEAKNWIPDIVTCQVKRGLSCQGARLLSQEKAHSLIEEKTIEAISKTSSIKPPQISKPVRLRIENIERGINKIGENIKAIDGRTVEIMADTVEEALLG